MQLGDLLVLVSEDEKVFVLLVAVNDYPATFEFERKYGALGLRTIRATGEFNDDIPDLMQGHYDVCLMTYEKATALLLANPHVLRQPRPGSGDHLRTCTARGDGGVGHEAVIANDEPV
jgi:hypothetical protein